MTRNNEQGLPVIQSGNAASSQLTRRKMVQRLLAGAGAAWPFVATSHPVYELLRNRDAVIADAEQLGAAIWQPIFLSSQQAELLTDIAESIVPESTRAHVSRFIYLLLSVDKTENRRKFVQSLAALDAEVQKRFGKSFLPSMKNRKTHS